MNRIVLIAIVLLSLLATAPDIPDEPPPLFMPLVYGPSCPEARIEGINVPSRPVPDIVQIVVRYKNATTAIHTQSAIGYNLDSGLRLAPNNLIIWDLDNGAYYWFGFHEFCNVFDGRPYKIRLYITLVDGCKYQLDGEFMPVMNDPWCYK